MLNRNICPNCCETDLINGVCPKCNYRFTETAQPGHVLPQGNVLADRYFIGRVLGEGGFGITYIGFDTRLDMRVAIKEYYPTAFAGRENGSTAIYAYSGEKTEYFKKGLDRFLKEAKSLSMFAGEAAIVTVRDFFHANNTAYIIMEFVEGDSLSTVVKKFGRIKEDSAIALMKPMIKALAKMHKAGIIHRDIAPDNIMLQRDGSARLIDFGAASEVSVDNKATMAMIKRGFAPEEQHDDNRARQGSWTDVYAMCATLYYLIEGIVPVDSFDRLRGTPLKDFTAPISANTKSAILKGLEVNAKNRTQTMDELLIALESAPAPTSTPAFTTEQPAINTVAKKPNYIKIMSAIAAAVVLCVAVPLIISLANKPQIEDVLKEETTTTTVSAETAAGTRRTTTAEREPDPTMAAQIAETTATTVTTTRATTTTPPPTTTQTTVTTMDPYDAYYSIMYEINYGTGDVSEFDDPFAEWTPIYDIIVDRKFAEAINKHFDRQDYKQIYKEEVETITSLDIRDLGITDLTGIEYFTSLKSLYCSGNQLTSLPALPNSLKTLACGSNQLTALPTLPNSLVYLSCGHNQLTSLPTLPDSLEELLCSSNNLTSLPALPGSLTRLECSYNSLRSLPALPDLLDTIHCQYNDLTSLPALPNSLIYLNAQNNPDLDIKKVKFKDGSTALEHKEAGTMKFFY